MTRTGCSSGWHEVLDGELTGRLRALAGLRNRLVHVYDRIDDVRVHAALTEGLGDLEAFGQAVSRFATGQHTRGAVLRARRTGR